MHVDIVAMTPRVEAVERRPRVSSFLKRKGYQHYQHSIRRNLKVGAQ
jgi:hypothetical protein